VPANSAAYRTGHTYLDYTGGGQYAEFQLREHIALLNDNVFGNPHSKNLTSLAMTEIVEETRARVLEYFNASPDEYAAIFTANATGALRLVGEAYPFDAKGHLLLTFDNHNSVNGIREFARAKGARVTYVPILPPDLRMDEQRLDLYLNEADPDGHNLFSYPAQSNFSGVQHPFELIERAKAKGWDVLVDCASFVPTNRLDLSQVHPDFVPLSFYKMFGYPTGVGCLLARREALTRLKRPWYAGGTITFSSVQAEGYYLTPGEAGFEDGTINYLNLPAIGIGLDFLESAGIDTVHERVTCLTGWVLDQITSLRHSNGKPLVRVYGPLDTHIRGGTIEFNFYDPQEHLVNGYVVEKVANESRISIRVGCHCNPGAREVALGLDRDELAQCFLDKERMTYDQFLHVIDGKTTGAMRASLGLPSNFDDVWRLVEFIRTFRDKTAGEIEAM